MWIKFGDNNTKLFHNCSNQRRRSNTIWEIQDEGGNIISTWNQLQLEVVEYFKVLYYARKGIYVAHQLRILENYPCFFFIEEDEYIGQPVTLGKME